MIIINLGIFDELKDYTDIPKDGDYLYSKKDQCIYRYNEDAHDWLVVDTNDTVVNTGLTNYELQKQIVAQFPSLITEQQLSPAKKILRDFIDNYSSDSYFMLLCNDIHYYTVFKIEESANENVEDIIIECLQDVGVVQHIEYDEDNQQVECWIKNENGAMLFMLFNYDWGVVKCR